MEATPVDLDAQQLFQAHVAQVHRIAEMREQVELALLVGCFKDRAVHAERPGECLGGGEVEPSILVEEAYLLTALARLDNDLLGAGVQPAQSRIDQLLHDLGREGVDRYGTAL